MTARLRRAAPAAALVLALALAAALAAPAAPVGAQAGAIGVGALDVRSDDPTAITFSARVSAPAGLAGATLIYEVLNPKAGAVGGRGDAGGAPGPEADVSYTLETRSAQRYIPVGSRFRYRWEFTGADGATHVTAEQEHLFLDGRYAWASKRDGEVSVYYYGGAEVRAERVLAAAHAALADTERLLQTETPYPVRVVVWASEDDGELAMRPRSAAFDALVSTGGQRVAPDLLFVFAATDDIVRHEAAHIVTAIAGDGPFTRIPSWLDEGTAVHMQRSRRPYDDAIAFAIAADRTRRLRHMESPPGTPGEVDVFYGQSWSTVAYLIGEYGEQRFADLYRAVRQGANIDGALEQVYGFDQDGLYNRWRESEGLDPIAYAPRAEPTAAPQAEATRAPLALPTTVAARGGGDDAGGGTASPAAAGTGDAAAAPAAAGGANAAAGAAVGAAALAIAAALGFVAFRVARRPG